jgi:hypothetical protein
MISIAVVEHGGDGGRCWVVAIAVQWSYHSLHVPGPKRQKPEYAPDWRSTLKKAMNKGTDPRHSCKQQYCSSQSILLGAGQPGRCLHCKPCSSGVLVRVAVKTPSNYP